MGRRTRYIEKKPAIFTCCQQSPSHRMSAGKTFPAVLTPPASEKEKKKRLPRQAIPSVPRNARHPGGNAPHRSTRRPEKFPAAQRAGARRRSPQRGSAAAGAHIARVAGRCAPTCPLRRAEDWVHVARQSLPPPHGQRGCTGVVGGVEGHAPLTPCRQPRRLPRPHAGLKPPASDRKIKKLPVKREFADWGNAPCRKRPPSGDTLRTEECAPSWGKCSPPLNAQAGKVPSSPASRGAEAIPATRERRSRRAYRPRSGKMRADLPPSASGRLGTCGTTEPPSATRTKGVYGGRRGCRGARPSHPLPPAAQATTPPCRAEATSQQKRKGKERTKRRPRSTPDRRSGGHCRRRAARALPGPRRAPRPSAGR